MKKFIAAMAVFAHVQIAQAQAIPIVSLKTPYGKVRAELLKLGWRPVKQQIDQYDTMANEHRSLGWIEVESCAGSGLAPCVFIWENKQGKTLEVVTIYENPVFNGFR